MDCLEGSVHVDKSDGKVAYASQTAWLESATIRENIVFQSEFDQARYGGSSFPSLFLETSGPSLRATTHILG